MSLAEFQRALGDLIASPLHSAEVAAQPQRALHDYALTQRERRRLWVMARSSGMRMNCTLYRINRIIPIHSVLPRTCHRLGEVLGGVLDAYFADEPESTLQYLLEAHRFAHWLLAHPPAIHWPVDALRDLLTFELACHHVMSAPRQPPEESEDDPRLCLVTLRHDIGSLLGEQASAPTPLPDPVTLLLDARGDTLGVMPVDAAPASQ
ncbi:hypothetical protein ISN75_09225 [Dyella marensis]|uniref:hypothetical protein n=1 Tax=Dyella marensis TaxID=500610 RepID=UPI0031D9D409